MNRNATDKPNPELDALYCEVGDVEPAPSSDRIIRARAAQAAADARPGKGAWLGGLATASVAIAVMAVVLQQAPVPESAGIRAPDRQARPAATATETLSRTAPATTAADAAESEAGAGSVPTRDITTDVERSALAAPTSPEQGLLLGARLREADTIESQHKVGTDEALFEQLRALIEAGRLDEARRLIDEQESAGPAITLPEDIASRLSLPQAGSSETKPGTP
ncbi:MAG: hypothetical protein RQ729_01075 [Wenzhouxiangellaceae bacterium]|nr:hypothetical protein [Wenzhouxiangellaceae bacterium]